MSEDVEIIARKSGNAQSVNGIFTVAGVIFIALNIFLCAIIGMAGGIDFRKKLGGSLLIIAMLLLGMLVGVFFLVFGMKRAVKCSSLPNELIKYKDGELIFADGYRCKPSDVVSADCFRVERDGTPKMQALRANPDAWITITTKDRTITYEQVEAVRDAYEKLMQYVQLNDDATN